MGDGDETNPGDEPLAENPKYDQAFFLALAAKGKDTWNAWRRNPAKKDVRVTFAGIDFSEAPKDKIDFSGFEFGHHANFSKCNLQGGELQEIEEHEAFAPGRAWFAGAAFGHETKFTGASFGNQANFTCATFRHGTNFAGAVFGYAPTFPGAEFGHRASFAAVNFIHRAKFTGATFADEANFTSANFGDKASFAGVTFGEDASFASASFGDRAAFIGAATIRWRFASKLAQNRKSYRRQARPASSSQRPPFEGRGRSRVNPWCRVTDEAAPLQQGIRREWRSPPSHIGHGEPLAASRGDSVPRRLGRAVRLSSIAVPVAAVRAPKAVGFASCFDES